MKSIKKTLREDLTYAHVDDASPENLEYKIGIEEEDTKEAIRTVLRHHLKSNTQSLE